MFVSLLFHGTFLCVINCKKCIFLWTVYDFTGLTLKNKISFSCLYLKILQTCKININDKNKNHVYYTEDYGYQHFAIAYIAFLCQYSKYIFIL